MRLKYAGSLRGSNTGPWSSGARSTSPSDPFVLSVERMEVRRLVITIIHGDHYPKESAELWHRFNGSSRDPHSVELG